MLVLPTLSKLTREEVQKEFLAEGSYSRNKMIARMEEIYSRINIKREEIRSYRESFSEEEEKELLLNFAQGWLNGYSHDSKFQQPLTLSGIIRRIILARKKKEKAV